MTTKRTQRIEDAAQKAKVFYSGTLEPFFIDVWAWVVSTMANLQDMPKNIARWYRNIERREALRRLKRNYTLEVWYGHTEYEDAHGFTERVLYERPQVVYRELTQDDAAALSAQIGSIGKGLGYRVRTSESRMRD